MKNKHSRRKKSKVNIFLSNLSIKEIESSLKMNLKLQTLSSFSTYLQETTEYLHRLVDEQYSFIIDVIKIRKRELRLKVLMKKAKNYAEWKEYALEYDSLRNVKSWKEKPTGLYDWKYIKHLTDLLRTLRSCGQYNRVIHVLRSTCSRNIGNILNPELYNKSYLGTKTVIEAYQAEVIACLEYISKLSESQLSKERKFEFFAEARHAYGRTALLLSGGGGLGIYHFGVLKTLLERAAFPRVIAGSSGGSILAALIGVTKPEELHKLTQPDYLKLNAFKNKPEELSLVRKIKRFFNEAQLLDRQVLIQFFRENLGDFTFQQAYDRTGCMLNITVTGNELNDGNHVLNYLTAPSVLIWSAVIASCAIPYVLGAIPLYCKNENNEIVPYIEEGSTKLFVLVFDNSCELKGKKFRDGSLEADLPTQKISELFNVNFFIVSQVNPWAIPFMDHSESHRHNNLRSLLRIWEYFKTFLLSEVIHRANQLRQLGIFPAELMRYLNLITQTYTGHTTILPVPYFTEYFTLFKDPSHERLAKGVKCGSRSCYPKMNRIESAIAIERALETNYQRVKRSFLKNQAQVRDALEEYDEVLQPQDLHSEDPAAQFERLDGLVLPRSLSDSD